MKPSFPPRSTALRPHFFSGGKTVKSVLTAIAGMGLCIFLCLWISTARASTVKMEVDAKASGKPLVDAVITLAPIGKTIAPKPQRIAIDQINKEFVPRVNVTSTGSSVTFPNKDDIRHQIYSFSTPKKFELKLYSGTPAAPVVFDKPGLVVLGCNIHDWMLSYLVVTDAPYYGKTDATGKLELKDISPGDYEVRTWHPNALTEKVDKLTVVEPGSSMKLVLDVSDTEAAAK